VAAVADAAVAAKGGIMKREARFWAASLLVTGLLAAGCSQVTTDESKALTFATPDEAVASFASAVEQRDPAQLKKLLGFDSDTLLTSGDAVEDSMARETFLARYNAKHQLVAGSPDQLVLEVGDDGWPLPFPLVREDGKWHFDGPAGADEIVYRRIGANELRTIDVMRGFVAAQGDYAAAAHDGVPKGTYAGKLRSDPGKHNGLYWDVTPGQTQSPAGPMLAAAASEGYHEGHGPAAPYHGYLFRLLTTQGPDADGGAKDYTSSGRLTGGYALVAWPAIYGASGVMSFMVNQDGVVYQRDLGQGTPQVAGSMQAFNPDSTWTPIAQEQQ
jgi:hypothetical protein